MKTPSPICRNGHSMSGRNLIWHTRYHPVTRGKTKVRECRTCANLRYRTKRQAEKRNRELELQALAAARVGLLSAAVA